MWTHPINRLLSPVGNVWTTTVTRGLGDLMANGFLQLHTIIGAPMAMGGGIQVAKAMLMVVANQVAKAKVMVAMQIMAMVNQWTSH